MAKYGRHCACAAFAAQQLFISIFADAVVANVDDIRCVVAPLAENHASGALQLTPLAVYHRVQAPLRHIKHLKRNKQK
jgi:hypothetical protein